MAKEYDGDYEMEEASPWLGGPPQSVQVNTAEYQQIAATFSASISRIVALAWLPLELAFWSSFHAEVQVHC